MKGNTIGKTSLEGKVMNLVWSIWDLHFIFNEIFIALKDKDLNPYCDSTRLTLFVCVLILFRVPFYSLCFSHRLWPLFHVPSFACVVFCLWNLCCLLHLGGTFSSFSSHLDHHSFKEVLGCVDQNEKIYIYNMYYTYYICKIYMDLTNGVSFNSLGYKSSLSLFILIFKLSLFD